jgi:glycosyltransferase 2 family protein
MGDSPHQAPGAYSVWKRVLSSRWLKGAIALTIVFLLIHYNRVDWHVLATLGETWPWLLLAFALMLPPFLIVSYRFQLILRSQGLAVPLFRAIQWTMIGSFFDLAMPSSNGGDVIKAGYVVHQVGAGMRTRAVMAVAFDRVLGLLGLFLLACVVAAAGWEVVRNMSGRNFVLVTSAGASVGVLIVFRILGSRRLYNHFWVDRYLSNSRWGLRLRALIGAFNQLREQPRFLIAALAVSMLNHVFWCASLLCIARAVGDQVDLVKGFVVFPLAIFGNVFGVAGGFGVGTAVFDLFLSSLLGIGNGALIGLLFQTLSAISKLAGLPYYLVAHRKEGVPSPLDPLADNDPLVALEVTAEKR